MKRSATAASGFSLSRLLVLLAGAALVGGCVSSYDPVVYGDASALESNYTEALAHYEAALKAKPSLAHRPEFVQKWNRARFEAALEAARAASGKNQWDAAVAAADSAAQLQPGDARAVQAQADVRRQAAVWHYTAAVQAADDGRLEEAGRLARRAAEFDPANARAVAAARSFQPGGAAGVAEAAALGREKRFQEEAAALAVILQASPDCLPARDALAAAKGQMDAARKLLDAAREAAAGRQWDAAAAKAAAALDVWPHDPETLAFQADVRRKQGDFDRTLQELERQAALRDWRLAVAAAHSAEQLYPDHPAAAGLTLKTQMRAAAALTAEGNRLLMNGQIDEARAVFTSVSLYVKGYAPAAEGLADAASGKAELARRAGRPGEAFLWWLEAAEVAPEASAARRAQALAEARAAVGKAGAFQLLLQRADAPERQVQEALYGRLMAVLLSRVPPWVAPVENRSADGKVQYAVSVKAATWKVDTKMEYQRDQTLAYTAYEERANPEIPRLQMRLNQARLELATMQNAYNVLCPTCGGSGWIPCRSCGGTGTLVCTVCGGSGWTTDSHGVRKACGRCGGRGRTGCPACAGRGRSACPTCHGAGRITFVSAFDLSDRQAEIDDLERRLRLAPLTVRFPIPGEWRYTVQHFRKTGVLEGAAVVTRPAPEGAAAREFGTLPLGFVFRQEDDVIVNPNPQVGLQADPLQLADDATCFKTAVDAAAVDGAARILGVVLRDRSAEFQAQADQAAAAGDKARAFELSVLAGVLVEPVDSARAAALFSVLRTRLRAP